mmetsp:Transcript_161435/g.518405  ORF Transcript_161435/g.518405 Transcript_161435/m.518405 type:complete len:95 (-) Transcript_161435:1747-2031(-)
MSRREASRPPLRRLSGPPRGDAAVVVGEPPGSVAKSPRGAESGHTPSEEATELEGAGSGAGAVGTTHWLQVSGQILMSRWIQTKGTLYFFTTSV